jgi:hypothetical protein|tara:strand:- start:94 stop:546 length:453 start_codon:yes stop_codon:yes gene_type:complete
MKEIELQKIGKYLRENDVSSKEAIDILKRALEINPTNLRSLWKVKRFGMYIAQRIDEDKQGLLGKKMESARRVVASKNYIYEYKKHHQGIMSIQKLDQDYEAFKLHKLITDPRQYPFFKSKYLTYPRSSRNIPQDIINKYLPEISEKRTK